MPKRPTLTPKQIERMYDSGENRVTQERSDFLLPQILEWVRQKRWINIRPEYQRRLVYVSNLTPDHLNKAIGRLGVSLNWDELGSDAGLRELFGGTGARETANDIQDYLKEFIKKRNKLAHTGSGGLTFTSEEVDEFLKFFRLFSKRLAQVLQKRLKQSAKQ